jgi:dipeptidase E
VKLLLTSGGVTNPSIHAALEELLGKPPSECHALCVPTAQCGHPMCGPGSVRGLIAAVPLFRHLSGLGWG